MRVMFALVFVLGLGLAGFAAKLIQGHLAQQEATLAAERQAAAHRAEVVQVYALREALDYGELVTTDKIGTIPYTKDFLPAGTFKTLEEIFPEGEDVPRMVLRRMEQLEPLLAAKVTKPGGDAGLVTQLGEGMRAFAIRTDVASGVSGFVRPGDRVDVFWTGTPPGKRGGSGGRVTRLIDSAVEVIAIDQVDDKGLSGAMVARTVTVKVTSQQVASLAQAQSTGSITLALVGTTDNTKSEVIEVDQRSLLDIKEEEPEEVAVAAPEPEVCYVRTRRGGEVTKIVVPCTN